MNTKIALSLMSIVTAFSLMGGATFAYFSDTGTSSGNTFSTGTLDLKLTNGPSGGTASDSVTATFGGTALVPGSCTGDQTLRLKNTGSIAANHVAVTLANTVTDATPSATPDMAAYLKINKLEYDSTSVLGQITNSNSTTFKDLADWQAGAGLDNLALNNLGTDHSLVMDICLDSTAGNNIQGDSVSSVFTFTLNQDVSQ